MFGIRTKELGSGQKIKTLFAEQYKNNDEFEILAQTRDLWQADRVKGNKKRRSQKSSV